MNEQQSRHLQGHRMNRWLGKMHSEAAVPTDKRSKAVSMGWKEAIRQWRALPEEERQRRRRASIPRKVARSMAFEGEPVDLALLEPRHARRRILPGRPNWKL
jgi:uncharacterized protein with von Willebrand factor type A (vWA) domain